jgi:integrase
VIRGSASFVNGVRIEGTTKSDRSRQVSLDAGTVQALRAHRDRQAVDQEIAQASWVGGDYVFTTGLGEPIHPDTPGQLMAKLIRNYNNPEDPAERPAEPLPHIRLHDLRHVHATTLLRAGVPVHVVAARLGHADPAITLRVYAHVCQDQAAGVADVFARALNGSTS